jgi:hypothetical protein
MLAASLLTAVCAAGCATVDSKVKGLKEKGYDVKGGRLLRVFRF